MSAIWKRRLIWAVLGAGLLLGLAAAFRPRAVPVDFVNVDRGDLVVTAHEEGETRIRDVFVLSAPVTGRARRIEAEVGDWVEAGKTVVAEIEPLDPTFLDTRSETQARAALQVAKSNQALAASELEEAQAEFDFARTEVQRARRLIDTKAISRQALDDAERRYRTTRAARATAIARQQVRAFELDRARAQLISPIDSQASHGNCACVPLRAPVSGRILRVLHESEGVVRAGQALVEIGDPEDLEIVADFLSAHAVRVAPGQRVIINEWGGNSALDGRVDRVEPFGFTKVSALGIEEQRVNVIIKLTSPKEQWARLGHGYRADVQVVLWEGSDVVKVPLTALFRDGEHWAAFADEQGRARVRHIELGRRNGLEAEVRVGLDAGERVIVAPSDRIDDGVRIRPRT